MPYVCWLYILPTFMLKTLFSLLFVATLAQQAVAQTTPATAPASVSAPAPIEISAGRRDTLAAISNLYERRRTGGKRWAYVGVAGLAALVRVLTASSSSTSTSSYGPPTHDTVNGGAAAAIGGLFVGLPAIIGIGNLAAFSEKNEQEVDRAYRSGQPLPAATRRQLKKKDFR